MSAPPPDTDQETFALLARGRASALPLGGGDTRHLAWVIAPMVFVSILAGAALLGLGVLADRWQLDLATTATVLVPAEALTPAPDQVLADVLAPLRAADGVLAVNPLSRTETEALIAPWLGAGAAGLDGLGVDLPLVIDLRLAGPAAADLAVLEQALATIAPGTVIDRHGAQLAALAELTATARATMGVVVAAVLAASLATVGWSVLTGLAVHRRIVELLHQIGATDGYIAGQFQAHIGVLTAKAAVIGMVLSGGVLGVGGWVAADWLRPDPALGGLDRDMVLAAAVAMLATPALLVLMAVLVARVTALRALRAKP